ncbi:MAG: hypothetical protein A3F17_03805 [Gammaproteobacteria bacterium RIFCSPHIGHO2_12_FULL_41_15]|nr:MAG: hypothetical protein A3F17_03805 [Gammaproteobacteria bacterium RIFCSPHIGHO2_12_FULL_41_15]
MQISEQLQQHPLIPVITLNKSKQAKPLAECLINAGLSIFEITLRTEAALESIQRIKQAFPDALVGAGTVISPAQMRSIIEVGCDFAVSPGLNRELVQIATEAKLPYLPGVSTCSEIMHAHALGLRCLKLFPAELSGGIPYLKQLGSLFPDLQFCPTGGVDLKNYKDYLALNNVIAIGGSFLAPTELIDNGNWSELTRLLERIYR